MGFHHPFILFLCLYLLFHDFFKMTNKLKSFLKTQTLKFKITLNYDVLLEQAKTINYPDEMLIRYTEI